MDRRETVLHKLGLELRAAREAADLPQQAVADIFGWGRDAIAKLERGSLNVSLYDYLEIVRFLQDAMPPEHPAVALSEHAFPKRRRTN